MGEITASRTDIFEDLSSKVHRDSDSEERDRCLHILQPNQPTIAQNWSRKVPRDIPKSSSSQVTGTAHGPAWCSTTYLSTNALKLKLSRWAAESDDRSTGWAVGWWWCWWDEGRFVLTAASALLEVRPRSDTPSTFFPYKLIQLSGIITFRLESATPSHPSKIFDLYFLRLICSEAIQPLLFILCTVFGLNRPSDISS